NTAFQIASFMTVTPFSSCPSNIVFSSSKPLTSACINSAVVESELNSTPSSLVLPSSSGNVNKPFGNPTYSRDPSSIVLANITATYGGVSLPTDTIPPSDFSKPNKATLSSKGSLWNPASTSIVPLATAISATTLSPYAFSIDWSFDTEILCKYLIRSGSVTAWTSSPCTL